MKSRLLITAFLIVSLLAAFAAHANDSTLIADETTLTYTKTGAKIITYSHDVFIKLSQRWGAEFKSVNKQSNHDDFVTTNNYIIYVSKATGNNIRQWAKKNL